MVLNTTLYLDGLKVYTTIDSKMQAYAEAAVKAHMKQLQKAFDAENNPKKNATYPFVKVSKEEYKNLMERAMKNSNRWIHLKYLGYSEKEIRESFDKKVEMRVFSWKGEKDTIMTPRDSILYYKAYLRTGMMSMEPQTGHIKAWVGGINYKHFQYDSSSTRGSPNRFCLQTFCICYCYRPVALFTLFRTS